MKEGMNSTNKSSTMHIRRLLRLELKLGASIDAGLPFITSRAQS